MNLYEVLDAVKDERLPLDMCERYRDQLCHFKSELSRKIADLKKKRALFMIQSEEKTAAAKKLAFDASPDGQKLIGYEGDIRGLGDEISSLQSRIFSLIR